MRITWAHIGFLALLLVFVASAHTQTSQPNAAHELGGTSWQLVKFESGDGKTLVPNDKTKYTIAFTSDGKVSVRIGLQSWTRYVAIRWAAPTPIRPSCADTRDVSACTAQRAHPEGLAVRAVLYS
jgi:hypothetical protein